MKMFNRILFSLMVMVGGIQSGCKGCDDKPSCPPGEIGCACLPEDACNEGLVCMEGLCEGETTIGFAVSDGNARSCEVLVTEVGETTVVTGITIDDTVSGSFVRQDPAVAVTFMSKTDAPIATGAVSVRATGFESGNLVVTTTHCYDREGIALGDAHVDLRD
jgi:hypothetical protein